MRQDALVGLPRKKVTATTDSSKTQHITPNLLDRDFEAKQPNQVWVADITYVATQQGWLYVAVILDLYARKVVAWEAAEHLRTDLPLAALRRAIRLRRPAPGLIHHSDRGCQYGSSEHRKEVLAHGIWPSMSRPRDCWDNAVAESFFGTMKTEALDRQTWQTPTAARQAVAAYIDGFYNSHRRHSAFDLKSPSLHESNFDRSDFPAS